MKIPQDIGWWYWLLTIPLLIVGLTGRSIGLVLAMGFTIIQAIHFAWRERSIVAFSVQVRIAYLGLLLLGAVQLDSCCSVRRHDGQGSDQLLLTCSHCLLTPLEPVRGLIGGLVASDLLLATRPVM